MNHANFKIKIEVDMEEKNICTQILEKSLRIKLFF